MNQVILIFNYLSYKNFIIYNHSKLELFSPGWFQTASFINFLKMIMQKYLF